MWIYVFLTVLCGSLTGLVVYLATKNGSRAAQLEAIKEELKRTEKERAKQNEINNAVSNMSSSDVRDRLSNIQSE